ncbi:MAG TPA: UMP kinase [Leucothrix mucor]|nr:UMP kinase [Leucothrix mucor]
MSETQNVKRVLLKLSGEALMGQLDFGIDPEILKQTAADVVEQQKKGVELALVIGGGNIFRGAGLAQSGIDRVSADQMGMLATVMNALAMQDAINKQGVKCHVMSALAIDQVGEPYSAMQARDYLDQGDIVIFAAGTGNPYFTTDTAASVRAIEIHADLLLKATKVDGIYDSDPMKNKDAKRYDSLSYDEAIRLELGIMDLTAMVLCRENKMALGVFKLFDKGALSAIIAGKAVGTRVSL